MEKEYGWISLHRKIREHWIWDDPIYFQAWISLLLQVNHEDNKVIVQGELLECKRGQSLLSVNSWALVLGKGWTRQRVRTFFNLLQKDSMITIEGLRNATRLTVCNYDFYQKRQPTANQPKTKESQKPGENLTSLTDNPSITCEIQQPTDNQPPTNSQPQTIKSNKPKREDDFFKKRKKITDDTI